MIDTRQPNYQNTPGSPLRPVYAYSPRDASAQPHLTIITPFWNAGPEFRETARAVLGQSFQQFEWLIINDGSTDPDALNLLSEYRSGDPRIRVVDHPENRGLSAARNTGFREARTRYVLQLDADDLLEPTAAEKWLWALETHPEYSFVKGYTVGFGAQQYLWSKGFHDGPMFLEQNGVAATSLIRREVHQAVGGYEETIRGGLEDWDFWLRCASRGSWGGTVPEYLDWYRRRASHSDRWQNLNEQRTKEFLAETRRRYPNLWAQEFPHARPGWHMPNETVSDELPCENRLAKKKPRLLLIAPWMTMGGADRFNLDLIKQVTAHGWEVTVATTLSGDHSWLPEFAALTPDIFPMHNFLRLVDQPRFLRYLIQSRAADVVMIANSELGYLLLPFLRAHAPDVTFLDYSHMEEEWKNGGFPRLAVEYQHSLDLNVVSSDYLRRWMVTRGANPQRVAVNYIGVDPDKWRPDPAGGQLTRHQLGITGELPVVLYGGRICVQKQPRVFAKTIQILAQRKVDFIAVVAGDGPDLPWLRSFIQENQLDGRIRLLGRVSPDDYPKLLSVADIFFLPSQWEGISLAIYEAMAAGVAVVGAAVGGQAELVTPDSGILLPRSDEDNEALEYANTLERLLRDPKRRSELASNARERVTTGFRVSQMGARMIELFAAATEFRRQQPTPRLAPGPARSVAFQAIEYIRVFQLSEWLWAQRNNGDVRVRAYQHIARIFEPAYRWSVRRGWVWVTVVRARVKLALMGRR